MRVLTIVRSRWGRGIGFDSYLLNPYTKQMCCLGFDAIACGLTEDEIASRTSPGDFAAYLNYEPPTDVQRNYFANRLNGPGGSSANNKIVGKAMTINDNPDITDTEREALLIPLLKQLGWDDVVFVD